MNFMEEKMENDSHLAHQKKYEILSLATVFVCDQTLLASKELHEMQRALTKMKEDSLIVFANLEGLVRAQTDFLQSIKQLLTYSQDEELLAAFRLLIDKQATVTHSLQSAMKLFEAQDALSAALTKNDGHLAAIQKAMALIQTNIVLPTVNQQTLLDGNNSVGD